jgi:GrpB-like predicted nucleotidyltransferase (UPF0157 family)
VPHDPGWFRSFLSERSRITRALTGMRCRIEHVGSTAVPELLAKPIIDIAVGFGGGSVAESAVPALVGIGYEYLGDAGSQGGHVLVLESRPRVRTHHVHLVEYRGQQWDAYLQLRDVLRRSREARRAYAAEKVALARQHRTDREAYTAGKAEIVFRLIREHPGTRT